MMMDSCGREIWICIEQIKTVKVKRLLCHTLLLMNMII